MKKFIKIGIIFYKNSFIKILKINPINYDLKSNLEKEAILNSYKNFLKTCDFNFQILVQSKKEDISETISQIEKINEKDEKIKEIKKKYINYIIQMNEKRNSSSKNFYIVIKRKMDILGKGIENVVNEENKAIEYINDCFFKIKENLTKCGNQVNEINTKQEIIEVLKTFIK